MTWLLTPSTDDPTQQRTPSALAGQAHGHGLRPPYHVAQSPARVEAWSTERLPFEPQDWLKAFRHDLRIAVGQMPGQSHHILHAIYASPLRESCDTENILLYNVGASHFSETAQYGLRFERSFQIGAACPVPLTSQPLHYHDYFLVPVGCSFRHWTEGGQLGRWSFKVDPATIKQCRLVWQAMKTGEATAICHDCAVPEQYGLRLRLDVPRGTRIRPAEVIKPLFDGVSSALHWHDGTDEVELSRRIATRLGIQPRDVSELLHDRSAAILGRRRLLHRFRDGVQWNPQDDLCFAGELLLYESDHPTWVVHGEVFSVDPQES